MADQQSRLSIVIDSRDAERRIAALRAQLRELGRQSDDTGRNTDDLGRRVRGASEESSKFSKVLGGLTKFAKVGGLALTGIGAAAIKVSGDFEEAMNGVRAVSGAVGEDFTNMRELAKKMGSETAYSATEAANGMEFLAMAGLNTEQIMKTLPNALNLAAAGNIGLAESADILSNIMTGMGVSADESGRAADVLAATAAAANVDVKMLGESMKYAAPIAKQLGISLEDTAASMGILGNAGIQGGEAGTALRAIYTRLATHKKSKEWFDSLGLSVTDASGNMKGMVTILKELQGASQDLSAQDKLSMYKDTVGTEAMSALGVTIDSITDGSLDRLIEKLDNAEGSAKKMADIRMEGFNGAIKGAKSAAEGFLIAIGDSGLLDLAAGAVTGLANGIRALTEWLPTATADITAFFQSAEVATAAEMAMSALKTAWDNLVSVIRAAGDVIAPVIDFFREHDKLSEALAISIGLVAGAFVVYNAAVAIGTAVTGGFVAVLAILTSPITLTIAALVALTAAGVYLYQNWDEIKAKGAAIWQSIKDTISGKVEAAKQAIIDKWNAIKTATSNKFNEIKNSIVTTLKELPSKLLQIGKDIVQGLIDGIKGKAQSAVDAVKNISSNMYQGVKNFFVIRSPSRLMRQLGVHTIEGLILGIKDKKSDAYKAAVSVAQSLLSGIESTQKEIALFGNNSAVSAFDYDVLMGNYDNVAPKLREQYRADLLKLENMKAQEKARMDISKSVADRVTQFKSDQDKSATAFGGLDVNKPQSEAEKLRIAYQEKMAIVDEYERLHTDKKAQAEASREQLTENYNQSIRNLELQKQSQTVGSIAAMFGMALGETSKGYKAMFAVQKAYDFVQAQSASFTAIAKAWSSAPFPANLPAVATTTLSTGIIPAAIQALSPKGFKTGGYTGNMGVNQVAGAVHGQEYVFDAQSTKRIGVDNLNAIRSGKAANGGGDVNISVTVTGDKATVSGDNEKMGRDMANGIKAVVMDVMRKEKRQGGMLYGA